MAERALPPVRRPGDADQQVTGARRRQVVKVTRLPCPWRPGSVPFVGAVRARVHRLRNRYTIVVSSGRAGDRSFACARTFISSAASRVLATRDRLGVFLRFCNFVVVPARCCWRLAAVGPAWLGPWELCDVAGLFVRVRGRILLLSLL